MLIGYARVSTEDQVLHLQKDALVKAGVELERIYEEQVSGVATKRPQLAEAMKSLRAGDVLVVWRLDRLGRSVVELIKIMEALEKQGIGFRSLSESIDTTTAAGKMVFHMLAAFAEFERNLISERTRAGLKAALARGHRGGRKTKISPEKLKVAKKLLADPTITHLEVAKSLDVSRPALYRAMKHDRELQAAHDLNIAARKARRLAKQTVK